MMMKTDKSVGVMWRVSFDPRIKTRGYPMSVVNRVHANPLIHQWDNTPYTHSPLSVSTDYSYLKTDESVGMVWRVSFDPRVKTRGYPMPIVNRVRVNPLIHQWDRPTRTYNLSSVSTDYS